MIIHRRKKLMIQTMLLTHHYSDNKLLDYLDGLLSIMFDESDLINRTNQWFYNIRDFNKEHIIQISNVTIYNIPEEE